MAGWWGEGWEGGSRAPQAATAIMGQVWVPGEVRSARTIQKVSSSQGQQGPGPAWTISDPSHVYESSCHPRWLLELATL